MRVVQRGYVVSSRRSYLFLHGDVVRGSWSCRGVRNNVVTQCSSSPSLYGVGVKAVKFSMG